MSPARPWRGQSNRDATRDHQDIAVALGELRAELRTYVERHDQQHQELVAQHQAHRAELAEQHRELRVEVGMNTQWREDRIAQERILRYLVGTNVGVIVGLVAFGLHLMGAY